MPGKEKDINSYNKLWWLVILVGIAVGPILVAAGFFSWRSSTLWVAWPNWILITSLPGGFFSWREKRLSRLEQKKDKIDLRIDLLGPDNEDNPYIRNYFAIQYQNLGEKTWRGEISVYVYPNPEGGKMDYDLLLQEGEKKGRLKSIPFQKHRLKLKPEETQTTVYERNRFLQKMGLHRLAPHWVYVEAEYSPPQEGSTDEKTSIVTEEIFRVAYLGEKWLIEKRGLAVEKYKEKEREKGIENMKKELDLPDYYEKGNRREYEEMYDSGETE